MRHILVQRITLINAIDLKIARAPFPAAKELIRTIILHTTSLSQDSQLVMFLPANLVHMLNQDTLLQNPFTIQLRSLIWQHAQNLLNASAINSAVKAHTPTTTRRTTPKFSDRHLVTTERADHALTLNQDLITLLQEENQLNLELEVPFSSSASSFALLGASSNAKERATSLSNKEPLML